MKSHPTSTDSDPIRNWGHLLPKSDRESLRSQAVISYLEFT